MATDILGGGLPDDASWSTAHLDEHGQPRQVERRFVVEPEFDGFRVDHYLKHKIPRLSREKLKAIISSQLHAPGGRQLKPHSPVWTGALLVLRRAARAEPPCPRGFGVLHRDEVMMVVDKPAGLPVHASAKFYFNTLTRVVSERFPGEAWQICHRLDRDTSGALVLAQGRAAASVLKGSFAKKTARKTYLAVVRGEPSWATTEIDLPLGLVDRATARVDVRMEVRADGLPSITRCEVVRRVPGHALVRCVPVTGRQHQIRAHLAAIGHPLVGDKLYGQGDEVFRRYCDEGLSAELLALLGLARHALHAATIEVPHPLTGTYIKVEAPLPSDLQDFLCRAESA